jgi:hypothetical protein
MTKLALLDGDNPEEIRADVVDDERFRKIGIAAT